MAESVGILARSAAQLAASESYVLSEGLARPGGFMDQGVDRIMVKRVLMVAYHYPPFLGSSGIQRTLKFSQYLPQYDWEPVVLTVHPRAYANTTDDQIGEISDQVTVHRAFALDTSRHLSIMGRHLRMLALPDRWVSWWFGAVPAGLRLIRKYRPDVIWSTYPIATAHLIGLTLHRLTEIPWVADLRDPMTDEDYPSNRLTKRVYEWIERATITHCTKAICTTPGTVRLYQGRFPHIPTSRFGLIENGYDEENFAQAPGGRHGGDMSDRPFVLVHSGVIYPSERDPTHLFQALATLSEQGRISAQNFKLILRAAGHDEYLTKLINEHRIGPLVCLAPPIPYRDALCEMLSVDGLLVLQASNCNNQIPAKIYEYLRAQRPILALTDPQGDTAAALKNAGISTIARLDSKKEIMDSLVHFLGLARRNEAPIASLDKVLANSRQSRSIELARTFDMVVAARAATAP
jgi:glycosyltransferase involved in cell wall biosynthesis